MDRIALLHSVLNLIEFMIYINNFDPYWIGGTELAAL